MQNGNKTPDKESISCFEMSYNNECEIWIFVYRFNIFIDVNAAQYCMEYT